MEAYFDLDTEYSHRTNAAQRLGERFTEHVGGFAQR